jgi:small-conductance mechanosensitive channel
VTLGRVLKPPLKRSSSPPSAVATFVDQYLARHEIRKWIIRRFRAEGIEIPFPIRTIELKASPGKVTGS